MKLKYNYVDPNKSFVPDKIPGRLRKEQSGLLNLSHFCSTSLLIQAHYPEIGHHPTLFHCSKKGSPSNYRPISLTSVIVKCLEQLLHRKISAFLTNHQKLSPHQHGFESILVTHVKFNSWSLSISGQSHLMEEDAPTLDSLTLQKLLTLCHTKDYS